MLALLLLVERRNVLPALLYSVSVTAFTFVVFHFALKAPLPTGRWVSRVYCGRNFRQPLARLLGRASAEQSLVCLDRLPHWNSRWRAAWHRSAVRHQHPLADDLRSRTRLRPSSCLPASTTARIRRVDHVDPDAHSRRSFFGHDVYRRYAMAKRGRAGAALSIAAVGSWIAGTFGIIMLTLIAPPLADLALNSARRNTRRCWSSP